MLKIIKSSSFHFLTKKAITATSRDPFVVIFFKRFTVGVTSEEGACHLIDNFNVGTHLCIGDHTLIREVVGVQIKGGGPVRLADRSQGATLTDKINVRVLLTYVGTKGSNPVVVIAYVSELLHYWETDGGHLKQEQCVVAATSDSRRLKRVGDSILEVGGGCVVLVGITGVRLAHGLRGMQVLMGPLLACLAETGELVKFFFGVSHCKLNESKCLLVKYAFVKYKSCECLLIKYVFITQQQIKMRYYLQNLQRALAMLIAVDRLNSPVLYFEIFEIRHLLYLKKEVHQSINFNSGYGYIELLIEK